MHSVQLTHTDLKPENILLCSTELVKTKVFVLRIQRSEYHEVNQAVQQTLRGRGKEKKVKTSASSSITYNFLEFTFQ